MGCYYENDLPLLAAEAAWSLQSNMHCCILLTNHDIMDFTYIIFRQPLQT